MQISVRVGMKKDWGKNVGTREMSSKLRKSGCACRSSLWLLSTLEN